MRLTSFTDYSLRVLIYLGVEPGRRATIAQIAEAFDISENHLTKVVHFLGKAGFLANVRGRGGGLHLARPPAQICIGDVVRATEQDSVLVECFDAASDACAITRACRLRGVLQEAREAFHAVLDRYTLADLVGRPRALEKLLFVPTVR